MQFYIPTDTEQTSDLVAISNFVSLRANSRCRSTQSLLIRSHAIVCCSFLRCFLLHTSTTFLVCWTIAWRTLRPSSTTARQSLKLLSWQHNFRQVKQSHFRAQLLGQQLPCLPCFSLQCSITLHVLHIIPICCKHEPKHSSPL